MCLTESKLSLTSHVKEQLWLDQDPVPTSHQCVSRPHRRSFITKDDRLDLLSKKVSEGDISGVVRLSSSNGLALLLMTPLVFEASLLLLFLFMLMNWL